jgi:hypothetical protein
MKSLFVLLLLVLLSAGGYFVYSSRSNSGLQKNSGEMTEVREVSASGRIQSLGVTSVPGSGTHLLFRADGSTVLLTALGADLDPYNGQQVEVEGRLTTTPSGKELIQVLRVSEQAAKLADTVDSASKEWKKYENQILGVRFQRREFWMLTNKKDALLFTIPAVQPACDPDEVKPCEAVKDDTILVERFINSKSAPLRSFAGGETLSAKNLVGPDKLVGYRSYNSTTGEIIFVVGRDNFIYRATYTPSAYRTVDVSANDFHSLQNSFQFIPYK